MKILIFIFILLKVSICYAQNVTDTIIIPIGTNDRREPVMFYDSVISDTLKGYIVVGIRLNATLGDTLANLTATDIYVMFFRLTGTQHNIKPLKIRLSDMSKLSELSVEELRLYQTYSEKMISLYWTQPYNRLKEDIVQYGNTSGIAFGCPFVIIPNNEGR
jgi:hypothetical protein